MFWVALLVFGLGSIAMELIRPKPAFENARPSGLGDFSFPTATEGRAIPLIWGKIKLTAPNVLWYGDLRTVAIEEEIDTGLFSSETIIKGYRYYIGMHFGLCLGDDVSLHRFEIDEKSGLNGTWNGDGVSATVNRPTLLGGDEFGQGGLYGVLRFYSGSKTQTKNDYLDAHQSPTIAYRGIAHAVWEVDFSSVFPYGWVGNSPNIPAFSFVLSRYPDGLNLAGVNPGAENPYDGGCNPMNVIYEVLTDTDWGLGISSSAIDITNFRDVADVLYDEGNGFAMMIDSPKKVEEIIQEIERQINGTLYFDRASALWKVKLVRDDYTVGDLTVFDEDNIVALMDYTRQTWEETTNQVRVKYVDNTKNWQQTFALAQDIANIAIQGVSVSTEVNYPACQNADLANDLAWRDLKVLAFPLGKINVKMNREGFDLVPGDVFKWSWLSLGVEEVVYRVQEIDPGNIDSQEVIVAAVQDVFAAGVGSFSAPIASSWVDEPTAALAPDTDDTLVVEAPRQMVVRDPYSPTLQPRVWMGARWPGGGTINFEVWSRTGTVRPLVGSFAADGGTVSRFLLVGGLDSGIDAYGSVSRPDTTYYIDVEEDPDTLTGLVISGSAATISSLLTIVYIDGEYIGYQTITDLGGGVVRLANIWRGLFHTAPKDHAAGTKVWFIGQTGGNLSRIVLPAETYDEVDVQLRSQDTEEVMAQGDTPIEEVSLDYIWKCPLAPRDPKLHGSFAPASATMDTQYTTETGMSGDNARALKVEITPRAWRVDDPIADTDLNLSSPAYLDDSPSFDFVLVLNPGGSPTALDAVAVSGTETPIAYILRNSAIVAMGAGAAIPSTGRIRVTAEHVLDSTTYTNPVDMEFDFTVTSSIQSDDILHGGFDVNTASTAVDYGETGTYVIDIQTALPSGGILEANIDGGGWNPVVAALGTSGNLVTSGTPPYSVQLRFTQAPASDQFFTVTGPTSEVGHGVLNS